MPFKAEAAGCPICRGILGCGLQLSARWNAWLREMTEMEGRSCESNILRSFHFEVHVDFEIKLSSFRKEMKEPQMN